jgi:hypothetical protein
MALGLPAAATAAGDAVAAAAAADREGPCADTAAQLAGRVPGTWAHLGQEAALEAALLVVLYIAGQKPQLLSKLVQGVERTFTHL